MGVNVVMVLFRGWNRYKSLIGVDLSRRARSRYYLNSMQEIRRLAALGWKLSGSGLSGPSAHSLSWADLADLPSTLKACTAPDHDSPDVSIGNEGRD